MWPQRSERLPRRGGQGVGAPGPVAAGRGQDASPQGLRCHHPSPLRRRAGMRRSCGSGTCGRTGGPGVSSAAPAPPRPPRPPPASCLLTRGAQRVNQKRMNQHSKKRRRKPTPAVPAPPHTGLDTVGPSLLSVRGTVPHGAAGDGALPGRARHTPVRAASRKAPP